MFFELQAIATFQLPRNPNKSSCQLQNTKNSFFIIPRFLLWMETLKLSTKSFHKCDTKRRKKGRVKWVRRWLRICKYYSLAFYYTCLCVIWEKTQSFRKIKVGNRVFHRFSGFGCHRFQTIDTVRSGSDFLIDFREYLSTLGVFVCAKSCAKWNGRQARGCSASFVSANPSEKTFALITILLIKELRELFRLLFFLRVTTVKLSKELYLDIRDLHKPMTVTKGQVTEEWTILRYDEIEA